MPQDYTNKKLIGLVRPASDSPEDLADAARWLYEQIQAEFALRDAERERPPPDDPKP